MSFTVPSRSWFMSRASGGTSELSCQVSSLSSELMHDLVRASCSATSGMQLARANIPKFYSEGAEMHRSCSSTQLMPYLLTQD